MLRFWQDPKGWIARRLLNAAFRIDQQCPLMCDQLMGWKFERNWRPGLDPNIGVAFPK